MAVISTAAAISTKVAKTYLVKGGEVGSTILIDCLGLVTENLTHEVVENVREAAWDGELLDVLASHFPSV